MPDNPNDASFLEEQVAAYNSVRDVYQVFARVLQIMLSRAVKDMNISAIVQARAKEIPSFAEKAIRKRSQYADPVNQFTDLCGARVIVEFKNGIRPVCEFIRKHFEIDEVNSEDTLARLGVSEFGYQSTHFVVSMKRHELQEFLEGLEEPQQYRSLFEGLESDEFKKQYDRLCMAKSGTPEEMLKAAKKQLLECLCQRRSEDESRVAKLQPGPKIKAEIQVCTLLQHAWAVFDHDRFYKREFQVPWRWQRDANRIAATLEGVDEDFVRTIKGVDEYRTYYGAYMSRQEREEELRKLIAVSKYDKWNIRLARKTARIAISLEEWKQAEEMLKPFVSTWEKSEEGQPLKKALKIIQSADDPDKLESAQRVLEELRDPDTSAILMDYGWAQWKDHVKKGQSYLQWAIGLYPQNLDGYVFLAETYIEAKQESKALEVYEKASKLAPADPRVLAGLLYCRIRIHRNLEFVPVARAGLETTIEHCREWARVGVHLPWAFYDIGLFSWLLGRPYESLKAYAKAIQLSDTDSPIQKALDRTVKIEETLGAKLPELGWIRKLLTAGKAAKLSQMASAAEKKLRCLRDQHGPEKVQKAIEIAQEQVSETQRAHKKAIAECRRERSKSSCLLSGKSIVIVAGGCDRNVEGRIQEYKLLIETAFREYDGTVFSGCTDAGVGRLVGDLPASNRGMITKIAYIPKQISSDAKVHQAYTLCKTEGIGFSASDSIQNWIDIIAAGIDPSKVKLLGINGGQIAAFEYRLVLAMGAKVGILPDSGRAASEIFGDEFWVDSPGLIWLPNDVETVKLFVRGLTPCRALADHRESIAREIHEEVYRPEAIRNAVKREPNLQHWEELPEDLKESNRRQVDHIEEKLRAIGRKVHYVGKGPIDPIEFSDEQVEILAEMEHGRWTVERLLAGWRLGEKDIAKKKSPSLVAWSDLPDEIKKYDYDAVRDIPYRLGKWGYEIILEKQNGS